jgi:hypothetical protein
MKNLLPILLLCVACEGNISMQSEKSVQSQNKVSVRSKTINNGDTTLSEYDKKEESFSQEEDNKNIDFNVKDKTGISDEMRKKLKRENGDTTDLDKPVADKNDNSQKPAQNKEKPLKASINCEQPISNNELVNLKNDMLKEQMDSRRVGKAKQLFNEKCLITKQVIDILQTIKMENPKLELAKFLYGRTLDKNNFAKVANEFNLDSNKAKIQEFLK